MLYTTMQYVQRTVLVPVIHIIQVWGKVIRVISFEQIAKAPQRLFSGVVIAVEGRILSNIGIEIYTGRRFRVRQVSNLFLGVIALHVFQLLFPLARVAPSGGANMSARSDPYNRRQCTSVWYVVLWTLDLW